MIDRRLLTFFLMALLGLTLVLGGACNNGDDDDSSKDVINDDDDDDTSLDDDDDSSVNDDDDDTVGEDDDDDTVGDDDDDTIGDDDDDTVGDDDDDDDSYGPVDRDGDGYPIPIDCDDNDPAVHPNLDEVPYDGIDQDCTDGDLIDVDGDGYNAQEAGGNDCNDSNKLINPGISEITGNPVDEDCDGFPNDQDDDGYDLIEAGGLDCVDDDPNINPGMTELTGNLVDEDCSGAANDLDADGFDSIANGGGDCDDENPDFNPDANEICGNTLDENCDDVSCIAMGITFAAEPANESIDVPINQVIRVGRSLDFPTGIGLSLKDAEGNAVVGREEFYNCDPAAPNVCSNWVFYPEDMLQFDSLYFIEAVYNDDIGGSDYHGAWFRTGPADALPIPIVDKRFSNKDYIYNAPAETVVVEASKLIEFTQSAVDLFNQKLNPVMNVPSFPNAAPGYGSADVVVTMGTKKYIAGAGIFFAANWPTVLLKGRIESLGALHNISADLGYLPADAVNEVKLFGFRTTATAFTVTGNLEETTGNNFGHRISSGVAGITISNYECRRMCADIRNKFIEIADYCSPSDANYICSGSNPIIINWSFTGEPKNSKRVTFNPPALVDSSLSPTGSDGLLLSSVDNLYSYQSTIDPYSARFVVYANSEFRSENNGDLFYFGLPTCIDSTCKVKTVFFEMPSGYNSLFSSNFITFSGARNDVEMVVGGEWFYYPKVGF